mmetsp:Transcript_10063/g.14226  ORF Transcript_10063/g.14226 Transcript_10063/m.14226 type:complete len:213 (+) Transcript_10063:103-741(+)
MNNLSKLFLHHKTVIYPSLGATILLFASHRYCMEEQKHEQAVGTSCLAENANSFGKQQSNGNKSESNRDFFYNYFPLNQLWQPERLYPAWDKNWDKRQPPKTDQSNHDDDDDDDDNGVTRHIILVRHGQYDETYDEDEKRVLTPLGRRQAELTGRRLGIMVRGINETFGPCRVKALRVSDMTRAKETADIIAKHLPMDVMRSKPDPLLNEGL